MGSQDLFHKRKAKLANNLERKKAKRDSYDKVLIVCEGEKTEPNYFKELIDTYEINSANVAIDGSCGSSPKSVFERAVELYQAEKRKGDPFDKVFCVFDRDSHDSYEETLKRISLKNPKLTFFATNSIPCFEFWILLHFKYTTKPYVSTATSSMCNEVLKELSEVMPTYAKGNEKVFSSLLNQIEYAKSNAIRAEKESQKNNTDNPMTSVHILIEYLQNIKSENKG